MQENELQGVSLDITPLLHDVRNFINRRLGKYSCTLA
jgi:hypothetical protein